jgi:hypothetical protein
MKITYTILRRASGFSAGDFRRSGLFFVCVDCGHEIDVSSFTPQRGVVGMCQRTQAAAAMKKHREQTHSSDLTEASR